MARIEIDLSDGGGAQQRRARRSIERQLARDNRPKIVVGGYDKAGVGHTFAARGRTVPEAIDRATTQKILSLGVDDLDREMFKRKRSNVDILRDSYRAGKITGADWHRNTAPAERYVEKKGLNKRLRKRGRGAGILGALTAALAAYKEME